jgi:hypothetical protein
MTVIVFLTNSTIEVVKDADDVRETSWGEIAIGSPARIFSRSEVVKIEVIP